MWHVLHLIARPVEVLLGVFCVVTATLLYPGEDGKIQSLLEDLWVEVDEFKNLALSRHTAFMSRVARLETKILDLLFGQKLFSEQSIAVSFSVSVVSASYVSYQMGKAFEALGELGGSMMAQQVVSPATTFKQEIYDHRYLVALAFLGVAFGVVAIALRKSKPFVRRGVLACVMVLVVLTGYLGNEEPLLYVLVVIPGFICDTFFIAVTRALLRWAGSMKSTLQIAVLIIADISLALLLVSPYFLQYGDSKHVDMGYAFLAIGIAYSNVLDVALAAIFFLLCFLLLLHIACWPLLTRTLFRMQDIGTKGRRAILTAVGITLLGTSVFGGKFPELLAKVIEKFGG